MRVGLVSLALALGITLACMTVAAPCAAETDEQKAVALFDKGRRLAREGKCTEAIGPLLESIRYAEGVGPLLNLGACYETIGKTASAHRHFARAEEVAAKRDDRRREEAAQRVRALEKELSTITVTVPVSIRATTEIRVDGERWAEPRWGTPVPIDPGKHEIEYVTEPHPRRTANVTVGARADRVEWTAPLPATVLTTPSGRASEPRRSAVEDSWRTSPKEKEAERGSSTTHTAGLVLGGAGAVSLAASAILGVISISAHSSLVGRCPTYPTCVDEGGTRRRELDDMNETALTTGTGATITGIAGAVLVLGGLALYLSSSR